MGNGQLSQSGNDFHVAQDQDGDGDEGDNGFGQAIQSAQSLLSEATRRGVASQVPAGNGITAEALAALWDGRNAVMQSAIDNVNAEIARPTTNKKSLRRGYNTNNKILKFHS